MCNAADRYAHSKQHGDDDANKHVNATATSHRSNRDTDANRYGDSDRRSTNGFDAISRSASEEVLLASDSKVKNAGCRMDKIRSRPISDRRDQTQ